MGLESVREDIYRCYRCGYCRETISPAKSTYSICPVREELRSDHYDARGRVLVAKGLIEGKLEYTDRLVESVYTCTACAQCSAICPMFEGAKVDTPRIIRAWREEIVEKGLGPPDRLREVNYNTEKTYNPYGKNPSERLKWSAGLNIPRKADVLYFAGCTASYRQPEIAKSAAKILTRGNVGFTVLQEEKCCGLPQMWNGEAKLGEKLVSSNVTAISETGAKKVVATCPGCYMALKSDYPEITGNDLGFEIYHMSEFLAELVNKGSLEFRGMNIKVTYHDPCHLGRYSKVYDEPRKVIEAIPGMELLEMKRNRENALCCGSGIVVTPTFPKLSLNITERRIMEAKETGAEMIVTTCPSCISQLSLAARRTKANIEVVDLADLVARVLK
jgi:Fe-S oxidoreductase